MKTSRPVPYRLIAHRFLACLLAFCFINLPVWALSGFNSINGSASFNGSDTVSLNQLRAVIEWNDFNTNPAQLLQFLAGGGALTSNHAVLNKVIGLDPTLFQGLLEGGQGHIILVNPHGITIGSGAVPAGLRPPRCIYRCRTRIFSMEPVILSLSRELMTPAPKSHFWWVLK